MSLMIGHGVWPGYGVFGDSVVRHLALNTGGLFMDDSPVEFHAVPGGQVWDIRQKLMSTSTPTPFDVVVIFVGGNDLCDRGVLPERVCCYRVEFVNTYNVSFHKHFKLTCHVYAKVTPFSAGVRLAGATGTRRHRQHGCT